MLYLGEPDFDDTEKAARLLVRYRRAGGLSPDAAHMFLMMVADFAAVIDRADEIEAEDKTRAAAQAAFGDLEFKLDSNAEAYALRRSGPDGREFALAVERSTVARLSQEQLSLAIAESWQRCSAKH